jgi:hypothetical protein
MNIHFTANNHILYSSEDCTTLRVHTWHISMRRAHWGALAPSVRDRFIAVLILRWPCVISDRERGGARASNRQIPSRAIASRIT